ncbi:hypothetical protein WKS98_04075 [Lagierella sp. ICN-221743]
MEDKLYIVMQRLIDENDESGLSDYAIQFPFGNIENVKKFNEIAKELFSLKEIEKTDRKFTIDISSSDYRIKMSSPTKYDTQTIQIEDIKNGKDNAKLKIVELNKEEIRNFFKKLVKEAKKEEIYP